MALIPPSYLDCVVAVGFPDDAGRPKYRATGFLFGKPLPKEDEAGQDFLRVYLVTNRHVLEGSTKVFLRFNPRVGGPARVFDFETARDGKPLWTTHPDGEGDVAVQSINGRLLIQENIEFSVFAEGKHVLGATAAREVGLSEGDGVFVLGFPMGNVGTDRNYVIVRGGTIARLRDALSGVAKSFLIDAPVFPGNSGGPVVNRPEVIAIQGTKSIKTAYLIGMVSSYVPYQDVAVSRQTGRPRVIFEENSGLTLVVPAQRIIEAVDEAERSAAKAEPAASPDQVSRE